MTAYEQGFLTKCAERGVYGGAFLKTAAQDYGGMNYAGIGYVPTREERQASAPSVRQKRVNNVNAFYNNIVLPTKNEYAGTPGVDYDGSRYGNDFALTTPIHYYFNPFSSYAGWANTTKGRDININSAFTPLTDPESTIVHELAHQQNIDSNRRSAYNARTGGPHAGLSSRERDTLDRAYDFSGYGARGMFRKSYDDLVNGWRLPWGRISGRQEDHTTNREYRYAIYKDMSKSLGRAPTYDEFKEYIKSMPLQEIKRRALNTPNDYVNPRRWKNADRNRLEALRKAWLEVAGSTHIGSVGNVTT